MDKTDQEQGSISVPEMQPCEDDVLRRMLNTPPKTHKLLKESSLKPKKPQDKGRATGTSFL